jgi:hypothetical protein
MSDNATKERSYIQVCEDIMSLCLVNPNILLYFDACLALLQVAIVTNRINELGNGMAVASAMVVPQGGTETIQ